jgi:hypothetical protein
MRSVTRRRLLRHAVGVSTALTMPWVARAPSANAAAGSKKKYVQPVPLPGAGIIVVDARNGRPIAFTQTETAKKLHPDLPPTPLWAYDDGSGLAGQAGSFGMGACTGNSAGISPLRMRST